MMFKKFEKIVKFKIGIFHFLTNIAIQKVQNLENTVCLFQNGFKMYSKSSSYYY
jgi:hypothetical protein